MIFNTEPFARNKTYRRFQPYKTLSERAENKLKERLINPEKLMYDYEICGIKNNDTGELFTGKFIIPGDKFERIVKVIGGQEVSNLVREKTGKNFYFEIVGNQCKYFKTNLSENEQNAEISKLLEADQKIYDGMTDRFTKKQNNV